MAGAGFSLGAQPPESLASAWREQPSAARRAALLNYARAHPRDQKGALARLALGVIDAEQQNYAAATESLKDAQARLPLLVDYTSYYLAAAALGAQKPEEVAEPAAKVAAAPVASPLQSKAWLLEGQALLNGAKPGEAVRALVQHYPDLPQPAGDLALALAYEGAGDLSHGAAFYQQVYYFHPDSDEAGKADAALAGLRERMGPGYPPPTSKMLFARGQRLLATRDYGRARAEFQAMVPLLAGQEADKARVEAGAADFLRGDVAGACPYFKSLNLAESDADAERWYYLEECARRAGDDRDMTEALKHLDRTYPRSPWRFQALVGAANRFLVSNHPDDYEPLYEAAARSFPEEPRAPVFHWKYCWAAYIRRKHDAAGRMREHLRLYPSHPTASAALYWLGRLAEEDKDYAAGRAFLSKVAELYPNHYYGLLARKRLADPQVVSAPPSPKTAEFLGGIAFPQNRYPGKLEPSRETGLRIERARLLREAGLADLAGRELRFGARTDGQPLLLAVELGRSASSAYLALRAMKSLVPDALSMPLDAGPPDYWQLLFPLPYKADLLRSARAQGLDPAMVAALVRQESEFNPAALSPARAYGLTQVRPSTGRQLARRAGFRRFSNSLLLQPAANLRLGTMYLRGMLDQLGGSWEETLAAYNAGKSRVTEWQTWATYRDSAEFVETIPFTETREYVQSVLRNAELYRRLYGNRMEGAAPAKTVTRKAVARPRRRASS